MLRLLPALALLSSPLWAQTAVGPALSVSSNFGQWAQPETLERARAFGVDDFRDEIHWGRPPGFDLPETAFPDALAPATVSVILNLGHPDVEGGHLPVTPEGRAAFAAFAAAVVERFPTVDSVEVGNELNAGNFISGPMQAAALDERARLYAALLTETARAVRAARPGIRVLGGAAHSLPEAWLAPMMEAGAEMDALAFHPYGVAPEWIGDQIAMLRRLPGLAALPFEATEYGVTDPDAAPGVLIRAHCTMGLAGVSRLGWYPLTDRGDGLVPLLGPDGPTAAGRAWRLARERLAGKALRDVSPDPFTHACLYEGGVLVIWGAARSLEVPEGVAVLDAAGDPVPPPHGLSETEPLILIAPAGDMPEVSLGRQTVIADTGLGYALDPAAPDPFERFGRIGAARVPLIALPGQGAPGTPWRPYRGAAEDGWVRLDPTWLRPGGTAESPLEIVHLWRAPAAMRVRLEVTLVPDGLSSVAVAAPGVMLREEIAAPWSLERVLDLAEGDAVEVSVGRGADGAGDVVGYRIRLLRP